MIFHRKTSWQTNNNRKGKQEYISKRSMSRIIAQISILLVLTSKRVAEKSNTKKKVRIQGKTFAGPSKK